MKKLITTLCVAVLTAGLLVVAAVSATAGTQPTVSRLSAARGAYWGGRVITVYGSNFSHVQQVKFGGTIAWNYDVTSPTTLTVRTPWHSNGSTYVRVVTRTGTSAKSAGSRFTFTKPRMTDPIQGGLTARQAQQASSAVRAKHRNVRTAKRSRSWTAAMGLTAMRRARSWLGLPYSWAGGNGSGPTTGVCAHNGGDLDCHIVGFDCSGLTLNAWWPYKRMDHYAATQRTQAGRYHPAIGELVPGDLVFFAGYISGGIGHVGIYEGNGNVIEAPESGGVVRRSRLSDVISWNGNYRGATRPTSSGRQGAAPVVTAVTKKVSTKGGRVTVTGRNLAAATSVTIGKKTLYRFVKRTATSLVVTLPAAKAGTTALRVSTAWGTVKRSVTYVKPVKAPVTTPVGSPVTTPVSSPVTTPVTSPVTSPAPGGAPLTPPMTPPMTPPASPSKTATPSTTTSPAKPVISPTKGATSTSAPASVPSSAGATPMPSRSAP